MPCSRIAEVVEVDQKTIGNWQDDFRKSSEGEDFLNSRDFDPPISNVWQQQAKSNPPTCCYGSSAAITEA